MPEASRTISLELDAAHGPPRGRVAGADGAAHDFEGWLELLTVLATVLDGPAPGDPPRPTPDRQETPDDRLDH